MLLQQLKLLRKQKLLLLTKSKWLLMMSKLKWLLLTQTQNQQLLRMLKERLSNQVSCDPRCWYLIVDTFHFLLAYKKAIPQQCRHQGSQDPRFFLWDVIQGDRRRANGWCGDWLCVGIQSYWLLKKSIRSNIELPPTKKRLELYYSPFFWCETIGLLPLYFLYHHYQSGRTLLTLTWQY